MKWTKLTVVSSEDAKNTAAHKAKVSSPFASLLLGVDRSISRLVESIS